MSKGVEGKLKGAKIGVDLMHALINEISIEVQNEFYQLPEQRQDGAEGKRLLDAVGVLIEAERIASNLRDMMSRVEI